jgi:hypothetical protein
MIHRRLLLMIALGLPGVCTGWLAHCPGADQLPDNSAGDWPTERIALRDGSTYNGLIESEDEHWLNLIQVFRPRGRPMYVVIRPLERSRVLEINRLTEPQRAELRQRIEQVINRARIEAARADNIPLSLDRRDGMYFRRYRGKWFWLESTLDDQTTRRIVVRLEQVFTAFRQMLPPRTEPQRTLRIMVLGSTSEYQHYLRRLGIDIPHHACYLPEDNLVVAGSEFARFAAEMAKVQRHHAEIDSQLKELERQLSSRLAEIARQMKADGMPSEKLSRSLWAERRRFEELIGGKRNELRVAARENERLFQQVAGRMLTRLYHEAFHAYLESYVFPRQEYDVPVWLNEGLAQIVECGLLDGDLLRIDVPHAQALRNLKADLQSGEPLEIGALLRATNEQFFSPESKARYYAHAWGVAYYLTFEQGLLTSAGLTDYVRKQGPQSAQQRFEKLVGCSQEEFQRRWRQYILELK